MSDANDDEAMAYEWAEINSPDLFLWFDNDSPPDVLDNQPLFDNKVISFPQVASDPISQQSVSRVVRPRYPWGYGRDAMRCARFRSYPTAASPIFRYLSQGNIEITKRELQILINLCIASCSEDIRPNPPTRSQKRAKAGLVCWLDENAPCVMRYLTCQSTGRQREYPLTNFSHFQRRYPGY
jgi:hypothetical protein